jgi:polysaccharide biosynthesis/export protein
MKTKMNIRASAVLFMALTTILRAQETPAATPAQPAPAIAPVVKAGSDPIVQRSGAGKVGADDIIAIYATNCDEISRSWRVTTKGELNLPLIGQIQAGDMTIEELEKTIEGRLSKFVRDPRVSITITEVRSQPVVIAGAVERPGTYQLTGQKNLFKAMMLAGSFKDAGTTVSVTRAVDEGKLPLEQAKLTPDQRHWTAELELAQVMSGRGPAAELEVRANDVISIQSKSPKLVHVIGEVVRPGSVELISEESVSITKVLAVAGGLTRQAGLKKAMIRRIGVEGAKSETAVIDLKSILDGKAADIELAEGDVLIIPSSQVMAYIQSFSTSAVNAGIFSGLQILARF